MKLFGSHFFRQILKVACVFAGMMAVASPSSAQSGPFSGLEGGWSGVGTIQMANGGSERIRCRATYTVASGGHNLQQLLRCASDSYRFDLSSNIISRSGNLTGTWSEASRGISGDVEGQARNGQFKALVTAAGFVASLTMIAHGKRQTISIDSQNTQFKGVQITLAK